MIESRKCIRDDALKIICGAIAAQHPASEVRKALAHLDTESDGKLILVSAGKAAWDMASAALDTLDDRITCGVVITKYGHAKGKLKGFEIYEAGHPVPDNNSCKATERVLKLTENLSAKDTVLFLLSGGASALFEKPLIPLEELTSITRELLASGAEIGEINIIRKRLSAVKGGKFAQHCTPAKVYSVLLSDVLGDRTDMIASGPTCPDSSERMEALATAEKYALELSPSARKLLEQETIKQLDNVSTHVIGSVALLCKAASAICESLGYKTEILTTELNCEAKQAGEKLAAIAREQSNSKESLAFIMGGETVVHVKGKGKGGRNQEIALAAAEGIKDCYDTCVFSVGSDGTDGPTDAAGGIVDESTFKKLAEKGISIKQALNDNDSYHALSAVDSLIITGPTGTNVNDLSVALIRR